MTPQPDWFARLPRRPAADRPDPADDRRRRWTRFGRRLATAVAVLAVALTGAYAGVFFGARSSADVGPFRVEFRLTPATEGGTQVAVPPLGALFLDSHAGPTRLTVRLDSLDQRRTQALIEDPQGLAASSRSAPEDVRDAVQRLALRTLAVSTLGALLLSALAFRDTRRVAWSGALALTVTAGVLGTAASTIRPQALDEPRYEGLLVNAPALVGDARRIADDYERYAAQLQRLVGNVGRLYTTVSSLPIYEAQPDTTRVLHVSDLHLNPAAWPMIRTVVRQFDIDVVVDTGDLADRGSEPEPAYVSMVGELDVPYVYVRGSHDSPATVAAVAGQPNAIVLDDQVVTVAGVTVAGIGDPRFTPDQQHAELEEAPAENVDPGGQLAATVRTTGHAVDIAVVHDPAFAPPLNGHTPLVLAGSTHDRRVDVLPPIGGRDATRLMVQGSTGGAGIPGQEDPKPGPMTMSVLYLDERQRLAAYDDIRVSGTGTTQVSLDRRVIEGTDPTASDAPPATDTVPR
ncbi:metallophosphoesterase [Micromonospora sp. WMMA1363]|uniref:metallophosphoesterase n=1 Tax=Micromonospora sp. WMMA1363 TaxID=3053985 RepID=UPI00259CDBCD|nr:metallophosphoesterase [Micromonospora sp. WMMA1363]MDM4719063.1 metallophosphoesterase [Micromonospora sp. WMMA1363]